MFSVSSGLGFESSSPVVVPNTAADSAAASCVHPASLKVVIANPLFVHDSMNPMISDFLSFKRFKN